MAGNAILSLFASQGQRPLCLLVMFGSLYLWAFNRLRRRYSWWYPFRVKVMVRAVGELMLRTHSPECVTGVTCQSLLKSCSNAKLTGWYVLPSRPNKFARDCCATWPTGHGDGIPTVKLYPYRGLALRPCPSPFGLLFCFLTTALCGGAFVRKTTVAALLPTGAMRQQNNRHKRMVLWSMGLSKHRRPQAYL